MLLYDASATYVIAGGGLSDIGTPCRFVRSGLELTRMIPNGRELVQALVQALGIGDCHFRRGVLTTLSEAPGDKQPGGALSLPSVMVSHNLVSGSLVN